MKKAVVVDGNSYSGCDYSVERELLSAAGIELFVENCVTEEEIMEKTRDADAVFGIYAKFTKRVIDNFTKCKVMVRYGIGYDTIDVPAATARGIAVCNIPDYCIPEVATHAIALYLAVERKIVLFNESTHRGEFNAAYGYPIHRLSCVTFGLVGFGNIAREAAKYAKVFGMRVVAYDPYLPDAVFAENGAEKMELDELLGIADAISVHVPLSKETFHLINKESFAKMKDGVVVINTSRGALISEEDLIDAVKSGKVKAAGLDVTESEPIRDPNHPLLQMENIILTPHAAYNSAEAFVELEQKAAKSAIAVLEGEIPFNTVNKKDILK